MLFDVLMKNGTTGEIRHMTCDVADKESAKALATKQCRELAEGHPVLADDDSPVLNEDGTEKIEYDPETLYEVESVTAVK